MTMATCWCGNEARMAFGPDYLACACGTLVRSPMPASDITRVGDDERDLYGRSYWFERQVELGLPNLEERAVLDLRERCLHWLRTVLAYTRPPGRALELGAAHGGFVSLLATAGFEATGVELSPWVVDYATRTSGARMLQGPVEDLQLDDRSFDLIAAFDVLEHLPDPARTLARCATLIRDDGVLILQTPCRPRGLDYMQASSTRFREMLIPEHVYLFSEASARQLLQRVGLTEIVREPSLYDTDMTLVAGRRQPRRLFAGRERLGHQGRNGMKIIDTLLFLDDTLARERTEGRRRIEALEEEYRIADRDRHERLQRIDELHARLAQADRDRTERLQRILDLEALFARADRDRTERQSQIDDLEARYREADRDRTERLQRLEALEALLAQADRDRTERQHQVEALQQLLAQADRDRTERLRQVEALEARERDADRDLRDQRDRIAELETLYLQADRDRTDRLRQVQELGARYRQADDERVERLHRIEKLESDKVTLVERYQAVRALMADHRNSRVYKAMVRLGRWRAFDSRLQPVVDESRSWRIPPGRETLQHTWTPDTAWKAQPDGAIAIDLTAILPGGENGGAKLVAGELVRSMARLAPSRELLLLTSAASHHEVAALEARNVRRRMVDPIPTALSELLEDEQISVLFCPMTASPFDDPRVPVVCLVHDLQFLTYPEFFDEAERHARRAAFQRAVRTAEHIVTPSTYVRNAVLEHADVARAQVTPISHGFAKHRLADPSERYISEVLAKYELQRGRYFIYPANFWPHKNHPMLLVAFGQFCRRRPDMDVRLVLTGASRPDARLVREGATRMHLADRVVLPGYVPDTELGALMAGALALVFPSLYEGFGMPVIEAFSAGCPVACSSVTSLPEVGGDAALYFDPRKPDAIAEALERLATSPELRADLVRRGHARVRDLESGEQIASEYFQLLSGVASEPRRARDQLAGIFADGWTTSSLVVAYAGGSTDLRLGFDNPREVAIALTAAGGDPIVLGPQSALALRCVLPPGPGVVAIAISPTFRPCEHGPSTDTRRLGVRVWECLLSRSGEDPVDLLSVAGHL
jgi:glycosyltransferase involved in cell wall biosynthesis/SAM-dependent methyltransferase